MDTRAQAHPEQEAGHIEGIVSLIHSQEGECGEFSLPDQRDTRVLTASPGW
eukprot:m.215698 g.215698  ORF g.215698 m.215698 type:complete len:51 (-) comp15591_c0_seq4:54-206(-)